MPAFTQEQANKYYNTLTDEQKAQIGDQINNESWAVEWFTNAVNAGVPGAIKATGNYSGPEGGNNENEGGDAGVVANWADAAEPEEWLGKRAPTPGELRKWAKYQHQDYLAGGSGQDEDYDRVSDRVLSGLIKKTWDVNSGGWKPGGGNPWSQYDDDGNVITGPGGEKPGAGEGGQKPQKPQEPVKPTTYTTGDKQLSFTGNPLVDNMIQMFNQAQSQRGIVEGGGDVDRSQLGIFARGENMQVGGGDDLSKLAGMLMGTGGNAFLWTAVDDDAFGGLKGQWKGEAAKQPKNKQPAPPSPASVANPNPPPVEETTQEVVDQTTQGNTGPKVPSYKLDQLENQFGGGAVGDYSSPFYDMINNNYGNNANR